MKNNIKTFTLFVKNDQDGRSQNIANYIRKLNSNSKNPLKEVQNGDLIIAIGGDGTFINAVTSTGFDKEKIYAGVHMGTLGFLQNLSAKEVFTLIKYLSYEEELPTQKLYLSEIKIHLRNEDRLQKEKILHFFSLNEIQIVGNYSTISFEEHINGELFQRIKGNGIVIATSTGDTALSMNSNGAIDFSNNFQLVRTLDSPIRNAIYEQFLPNSIICSHINIVLKKTDKISILIDGIKKDIKSELIKNIEVSMTDNSNYIQKFILDDYSKVKIIREKILGYQN